MKAKRKTTRLAEALLETADDMRRAGILSAPAHAKITKRHLGEAAKPRLLSAEEIRAVRERSKMSQAVFAHHLNVTPGYVSQLERGTKRPTGAALALLNVIQRKGIDAIL
ncbi:MAG TPA: helix-turn-helix domain-containing protein [Rhizomicrobium sp.]|jgi:putative transcriptional regulator